MVAVTKDGESSANGRPVFAPGTLSPVSARTFVVAPGEEATDANIQLDREQQVGTLVESLSLQKATGASVELA